MPLRHAFAACVLLLASGAVPAQSSALKFTPHSGDTTVQDFADELGKNPTERQQLASAIETVKRDVLERDYAARGWKNNVAGAYAFFICSLHMVWSGDEPSTTQKDALFAAMSEELAPSLAGVSDKEKTALYNTLIASATLPLLLHVDGKQNDNRAELEQARELATQYSRRIMKMEPQALAGFFSGGAGGTAGASAGTAVARPAADGSLDGRYNCQMAALQFDGVNYLTQYRPTGMWFAIEGGSYSAQQGGGTIDAGADVVGFRGGAYDGWRGARRGEAIVFRKNDYGNARPGESIRSGDLRCGRASR
ncbi:MAG: hypothetical protein DI564_03325 [Rhodanobacter denitrificans]|uniref:Uncharacterized protein n=1 Tax=Rhodanobacter denitrificans TaxID=666685 RepID=A0A2W5KMV4_9GAMM|nr:MAG: hypothetical protein DI564_03325 [Rhodanobacter denitrificans]